MERYFRFMDAADATKEVVIPLSSIRGFDVTGATAMLMYFDGFGAYDAGGVLTFVIVSGSAKANLETFANAASSGTQAMITVLDESTGVKLHSSLTSFAETSV